MAVPASADYLCQANNLDQLQQAIKFAQSKNLSILVLGEGSNTLFIKHYQGLVVLNRIKGIQVLQQDAETVVVKSGAGENWHDFVETAVQSGWHGIENLALIPGLVGAAPIQNIGAYGVELKDCLLELDYLDFATQQHRTMSNPECEFAYRDSVFKGRLRARGVITAVTLKLKKQAAINISYPALSAYLAAQKSRCNPNTNDVFDAICALRNAKLPLPIDIPNSGSFFKNPVVSAQDYSRLSRDWPDLVAFNAGDRFKIAAAWLIETAGWKGKVLNHVSVHDQQALVIVNPKRMKGRAVLNLAHQIQKDVKKMFSINLEIEPQIY